MSIDENRCNSISLYGNKVYQSIIILFFYCLSPADSLTTHPLESGNSHLSQFATCEVLIMLCPIEEKAREQNRFRWKGEWAWKGRKKRVQ